ncbi:MAG: DUF5719 family protein [Actinomycetota bacterium]
MRRAIAVIIAVVVGVLAVSQVPPVEDRPPDFEIPLSEIDGATGDPSAWYCPWAAAGALRDSAFNLAAVVDVDAIITLPNPNPTEDPAVSDVRLRGPGARSIDEGDIARRGTQPGIVEFDDGPAVATTATWSEEMLTGDRCVVSVPKEWHLAGGITAEGFTLELQLFNPFAEPAKVTVEAISEFGRSTLSGFENRDVPGRSWVTEDLSRLIPFLDIVTLTIRTESGIVIPAFVLNDGTDEASWPATGQSTTWDFPVTSLPGLEPTLVLSNTGSVGATVSIDLFTSDGPILDADGRIVSPLEPTRIHLADLAEPPFAVRVRSNAPIGALIQAGPPGAFPKVGAILPEDESPDDGADEETTTTVGETTTTGDDTTDETPAPPTFTGLAAMPGTTDPRERWLVPGLGIVPGAETSIWVLNSTGDDATVTVEPLGVSSNRVEKVLIQPGRYAEIPIAPLSETGNSAVIIDATVPVSVAVSIAGPQGVAFIGGIGIG